MPNFKKRTQRQRGGPDPVAQRISSDLEADHRNPKDASNKDAEASAVAAGSPRFSVNPSDVDLSAGSEFVQAHPNDDAADGQP